jgi:hypothetical protein
MAGNTVNSPFPVQDRDALRAPTQVAQAIHNASQNTGVGFKYLLASAAQESSFKTDAKARTSSATGLFQFTGSTWLQMVRDHGARHGLAKEAKQISTDPGGRVRVADPKVREQILALRKDPKVASAMAAEYARTNRQFLERKLGGPVGDTGVYLAHFLGPGGAVKLLSELRSHPNKSAAEILPKAAAANPTVFTDRATGKPRSVAQIYDWAYHRIDKRSTMLAEANAVAPAANPAQPATPAAAPTTVAETTPRRLPGAIFTTKKVAPEAVLALAKLDLFTWKPRKPEGK